MQHHASRLASFAAGFIRLALVAVPFVLAACGGGGGGGGGSGY